MNRMILTGVLCGALCLAHALRCPAEEAEPVSGWTHGEAEPGLALAGHAYLSSPAVAEIDGNADNGLETAVGTRGGLLYAYGSGGALLWKAELPNFGCSSGGNRLLSSPAVGELFGDGHPYVVASYGGMGGTKCPGGVAAYDGPTGALVWNIDLKAFAARERFWAMSHSVFSTPALADVDGDGRLEIGFASWDRNIYLADAAGGVLWYYNAADTVWSSPAFYDIDGDGRPEMIIGSPISQNKQLRPPTPNGGYVYALRAAQGMAAAARKKGGKTAHYSFRDPALVMWKTEFDQSIDASPVVADVWPAAPGPEVIIGSGCYFPQNSNRKRGKWIKVLRMSSGRVLQTLPAPACSTSSPAAGDVDDDGRLEIVATINGSSAAGGDGQSRIMAWKAESREPLWSVIPRFDGGNDGWGGFFNSPVIADLDGNGSLEVIVSNQHAVGIYRGRDGAALTCQEWGCDGKLWLISGGSLNSSPAAADMDLDGALELVAAGSWLYGWRGFSGLNSPAGGQPAFSAPWAMFRGNSRRTGIYGSR